MKGVSLPGLTATQVYGYKHKYSVDKIQGLRELKEQREDQLFTRDILLLKLSDFGKERRIFAQRNIQLYISQPVHNSRRASSTHDSPLPRKATLRSMISKYRVLKYVLA